MKREYDIVVVGGGPAGSRFASRASRTNDVLLLEENYEIGKPVQCSGLVSPRVIEMSGLGTWHNTIRSVDFHSPGGVLFAIEGDSIKGYVIDRSGLDIALAEQAARSGTEIMLGSSFVAAERDGGKLKIAFRKTGELREVRCSLLVGADGMSSAVSRTFSLSRYTEIVSCVQSDVYAPSLNDSDAVSLYFGSDTAPGFFAWAIPGKDFTRIGLGITSGTRTATEYFERLLSKLGAGRKLNLTAGPIPLGNSGRMVADNVMLVGDAAGQVKPISGGGIFTSMAASDLAASVATDALARGDLSARALSKYETEWNRGIGRELARGALVRKVFLHMNDSNLDSLFRTLEESSIKDILSRGDIDYPTELSPFVLSRAPSLLRFSPQLIRALM